MSGCAAHRPAYAAGCESCRSANTKHVGNYRRRKGAKPEAEFRAGQAAAGRRRHGVRSRYVKGCRCARCTLAERLYQRQRRARKRANEAVSPPA